MIVVHHIQYQFFFVGQSLQVMWNDVTYNDGDQIVVTSPDDLGESTSGSPEVGNSIVCLTQAVNQQCCRNIDGGNVGEWFHTETDAIIPRRNADPDSPVYRTGYMHQVRLNFRDPILLDSLAGSYTCRVPGQDGSQEFEITITIGKWHYVMLVWDLHNGYSIDAYIP